MAHDIVADLRTIRDGRQHKEVAINAGYLIDAEDEIVMLRERVKIRDEQIAQLRIDIDELNAKADVLISRLPTA